MKIEKFKRVLKTIKEEFLISDTQCQFYLGEVLAYPKYSFENRQRFTLKQILNEIEILITGTCKQVRK